MAPLPGAIVAVLAGIVVTGAIAFGFSVGAAAAQPVGSSFWLEISKTAIGAFLGAGLAFASTLCVQWLIRYNERIAAGNVALAVLVRQANDYISVKASFTRQRDRALAHRPDIPLWLQFLPSQYVFVEDKIDPADLAFLFDKHGASAIQGVLHVQHMHQILSSVVTEHREVRVDIQQRQAELGIKPFDTMPIREMEEKIGPYLIARATSAADSLSKCFERDQETYETAFRTLRAELQRRFGKRFIDMGTPDRPQGVSQPATTA
jgi:hypothetical protein